MQQASIPNVLFIGHPPSWVVDELAELTLDCDLQFADALLQISADTAPPDLLVVYQSYYHEFHQTDIDRVIGLFPMTRWVVAYSPWCESLGHSDQVWPVAWIVPVNHFRTRLFDELQKFERSEPLLPPLSARDESFAQLDAKALSLLVTSARVRLTCRDVPFRKTASDVISTLGCAIVDDPAASVHIVVIEQWDDFAKQTIDEAFRSTPHARLMVVCDLLPHQDQRELSAREIATISPLRFIQDFQQALLLVEERTASRGAETA